MKGEESEVWMVKSENVRNLNGIREKPRLMGGRAECSACLIENERSLHLKPTDCDS